MEATYRVVIQRGTGPDTEQLKVIFSTEINNPDDQGPQKTSMLSGTVPAGFPDGAAIKPGGEIGLTYKSPLQEDVINYVYGVFNGNNLIAKFFLVPASVGGFAIYGIEGPYKNEFVIKHMSDKNGPYWALMIPAKLS